MNEIVPVQFFPRGGMMLDTDPLSIGQGNYGKALNIHHLTKDGETTESVEITKGNSIAYTLPVVSTQNKVYRIFLDSSQATPTLRSLAFYDGNAVLEATATYTPTSGNLAATYTSAVTAINTQLAIAGLAATIGALVITSTNTGYFSIVVTTWALWDYSIILTGAVDEPLPIITQEAIDASMSGQLITIGKWDLSGDLYVWSTTQNELPSTMNVTGAANAGGLIRIQVASTSSLVTNSFVTISGVVGTVEANGGWIITVVDATHFDLQNSAFTNAWVSGGVVTMNSLGLGEIGVAQKNDNLGTWTYTTLLRSREFNFRTLKQPKTYCERNGRLDSIYWTDNYNVPRVIYYEGAFLTNGAINFINPLGQYDYGTIALETILIQGNSFFKVNFQQQFQSGGSVLAGNHRYVVRLLTENLTPTLWSDPTNPINVCISDVYNVPSSAPINVGGNGAYIQTGKINELIVTDIIPNIFKYIELADIYYAGGAIVGAVIRRDVLTQNTTQSIQHRGDELTIEALDLATLSAIHADILTALSIDAVDNRLVLSNTTSSNETDLSEITNKWTHTLRRTDGAGSNLAPVVGVRIPQTNTYRSGEFMTPEDVNRRAGYAFNEIHRFGAKFKFKNGFITETFWIDDIRFDTLATNLIANPTDDRRAANFITTYDLTSSNGEDVYVAYLEFGNIDLEAIVGGGKLKDIVEEIIIERVELTDALIEVRGCGVAVMGADIDVGFVTNSPPYSTFLLAEINHGNTASHIIDYPFASGHWFYDSTPQAAPNNPQYDFTAYTYDALGAFVPVYVQKKRLFSLYCPDFIFGNSDYQFQAGDSILNYGQPLISLITGATAAPIGVQNIGAAAFYSSLREMTGYINTASYEAPTVPNPPNGIIVSDGVNIAGGGNATVNGALYYKTFELLARYTVGVPAPSHFIYDMPTSPVIATNQDLNPIGAATADDFGVYMVQYYRFKGSAKFGSINNSKYVTTGSYITITPQLSGIISTGSVFGGDVFTQKSYIKHIMPQTSNAFIDPYTFAVTGFGCGFSYYSQNRVNTQQRNVGLGTIFGSGQSNQYRYPAISNTQWLEPVDASTLLPAYNSGYNLRNGVVEDSAFDQNAIQVNKQPARIWWSDVKPENSIVDNYNNFLPLNFFDEDLSYGWIEHHKNINGDLQIWQQRAFTQEYFGSSSIIATTAEDAVLGNAGVMTRKGTKFSTFGTKHGFSVIKGKTKSGKDCTYWINSENGKVMRHQDTDGTVCLSDVHQMRSFFNNNLRFADGQNTPAHGEGIHGTWDMENSEAIWTIRANKVVQDWEDKAWQLNDEVIFSSSNFEQTPDIFISLIANNTTNPATGSVANPPTWLKVSHDDPNYYNEYTIAYNEVLDKFTTYYTFKPKIYLERGKSFLSPRPRANVGRTYEHLTNASEYATWYNQPAAVPLEQAEDGYISGMSINFQPNIDKHFLALIMNTEVVPERMEFENKRYETYMDAADFEARGDQFVVAVRNDSTISASNPLGLNNIDTSSIFGSYLSCKLIFKTKVYQKIFDMICKIRLVSRFYSS